MSFFKSLKKAVKKVAKPLAIGAALYFGAPYLAAAASAAAPLAGAAGQLAAAKAMGARGGGGTVMVEGGGGAPPLLQSFNFGPSGGGFTEGGGFAPSFGGFGGGGSEPAPSGFSPGIALAIGGGILALVLTVFLVRR